MSDIDIVFPSNENLDAAKVKRTEKLFELLRNRSKTPESDIISLIQRGIYTEATMDGETPLFWLANYGDVKIIKELITAGANIEGNIHGHDSMGATPLAMAAMQLHSKKCIEALIAAGANIDVCDKKEGETVLHDAVNNKSMESVTTLLAQGVNVEARSNSNRTPLGQSAYYYSSDENDERDSNIMRALLERGANIYAEDVEGYSGNNSKFTTVDKLMDSIVPPWKEEYEEFAHSRKAPGNSTELYHHLAVMPLADPEIPIDYASHIKQLFLHVNWHDRAQAENILADIKKDGLINAETAQAILAATFPKERVHTLQPRSGRGR